jgi:hypothetical protein
MSLSIHFELNCGQYVMFRNGAPVSRLLDEVAICFDKEDGTRHKLGDPEVVRKWQKQNQEVLRNAGLEGMADALVVIQGRFTLEDINKVIENTTYAATLYKKVMDGTAETLDIHGNVVRPVIADR